MKRQAVGESKLIKGVFPRQPWWSECGWPSDRHPKLPCGQPTVDGIQCARHAKIAAQADGGGDE